MTKPGLVDVEVAMYPRAAVYPPSSLRQETKHSTVPMKKQIDTTSGDGKVVVDLA